MVGLLWGATQKQLSHILQAFAQTHQEDQCREKE